ncbi:MAG: hypothetical protein EHM55_16055 [Acidobacteria bacterium]|nr:MAG: hypothetical protein EHM55_16055 [Acidobacteriota bacterium]
MSTLFGFPEELRVVEAAEIVLPMDGGRRILSITFSTSSADVVLMDSQKDLSGARIIVFHTDHLSFVLRAAARGVSIDSLRLISAAGAEDHFREVLEKWNDALPAMLQWR